MKRDILLIVFFFFVIGAYAEEHSESSYPPVDSDLPTEDSLAQSTTYLGVCYSFDSEGENLGFVFCAIDGGGNKVNLSVAHALVDAEGKVFDMGNLSIDGCARRLVNTPKGGYTLYVDDQATNERREYSIDSQRDCWTEGGMEECCAFCDCSLKEEPQSTAASLETGESTIKETTTNMEEPSGSGESDFLLLVIIMVLILAAVAVLSNRKKNS